ARIVETGNPGRQAILQARGDYPPLDAEGPLRLLVVGGSQSAAVFGRVVPPALALLPESLRRRLQLSLQYRGEDADVLAAQLREAGIDATVRPFLDRKSTRLNSSHVKISYAVFCLKKK